MDVKLYKMYDKLEEKIKISNNFDKDHFKIPKIRDQIEMIGVIATEKFLNFKHC